MIDIPRTLAPTTGVATRYSLLPPQPANPLWSTAVALNPVQGWDTTDVPLSALVAGANGHSRADALLRGAGEAVERRALHPDDHLPVVHGTATELGADAFPAHAHALAHPDAATTPLAWYPATRLSDSSTVLVPAGLVDWPTTAPAELFDPSPSGAASGGSRDMALRSALVEIVERDAFTTAWGRQLRLPCYTDPIRAVAEAPDRPTGEALHTLWRRAVDQGIEATFAHIPTAVPGLWCVVACLVEPQTPDRPGPMATVGMKASDHPHDALLGALQEAWQVRAALEATGQDGPAPAPDPVVTEHDRIRYMLTTGAYTAVRDWVAGFTPAEGPMTAHQVSTDDIVAALLADGADPLVVDLTPRLPATTRAMGWQAVKVIPAGYQHLRMDENHEWTWHLPRLATAPDRTGCPARMTDHRSAAPHPLP